MKTFLLSLTAAAALAAAASPAAAQEWRDHDGNRQYEQRYDQRGDQRTRSVIDRLEWKIANAADQRRITHREARDLRNELRDLRPIAWRVENGRASRMERQRLERGVYRIEAMLSRYADNQHRDYRR